MRCIGAPLTMKVYARVAGIVGPGWPIIPFALGTLVSGPDSINVPSTVKCSLESGPWAAACSTTAVKKPCATSPTSKRSRFFVKTVTSQTGSSMFESHKPAEQEVVIELLHQQAL